MTYKLSSTSKPNLVVQIDARHAEAFQSCATIAQRMVEILHGANASLGVFCKGRERLFGKIQRPGPVSGPVIEAPCSLEHYGQFDENGKPLSLNEQKVVVNEFRRTFNSTIKMAMSSVCAAFEDRAVYFIYYNLGPVALVQDTQDEWSLACLRFEGAKTMDDERACAIMNKASISTYSVVWRTLSERLKIERLAEEKRAELARQEEDRIGADMLDDPAVLPEPASNSNLDREEDELDNEGDINDKAADMPDPTDYSDSPPEPEEDEDDYGEGPRARFEDDLDQIHF